MLDVKTTARKKQKERRQHHPRGESALPLVVVLLLCFPFSPSGLVLLCPSLVVGAFSSFQEKNQPSESHSISPKKHSGVTKLCHGPFFFVRVNTLVAQVSEGRRGKEGSRANGVPRRPGNCCLILALRKTVAQFALGPQVAVWALFERRPDTSLLASPAGVLFLFPSSNHAPVAVASFTAWRCSYPGGAAVASLSCYGGGQSPA